MNLPTVDRMTNTEFVVHLMEYSRNGPLMQMFVIDALGKWADRVAASPPIEHGLINGEAWKDCAVELRERLNEKYRSAA